MIHFSAKKHLCASNYFQYIFHIIQQITDSLVFHFLRKTKSSLGLGIEAACIFLEYSSAEI